MEKKMETTISDRIWDLLGSYYRIPKAIFYLLKGRYRLSTVYVGLGIMGNRMDNNMFMTQKPGLYRVW